MATFSVIIPAYNIEKYLNRCLDSVINQTFGDLEIILVDDGSTDNTPYICDSYAASDIRIHVIHKTNGGQSSARKAGAQIATSDYIACVDGDDWIELDYFEKFANIVKDFYPDVACCGMIVQLKNGQFYKKKMNEKCGFYEKKSIVRNIYPRLLKFNGALWGKIIKRDLYNDVQLGIDDRIKIAEDACVVQPCIYRAEKIYILENCLYNYRYNSSSITKNKTVFCLDEPKWIAAHFEKYVGLEQEWFNRQMCNEIVHKLFNRCVSQFYQKLSYREICLILDKSLDDDFYQDCINKSEISLIRSPKEWFAKIALKRRLYRLMDLYSKVK